MAFYKSIEIKPNTKLYLWKIEEDLKTLSHEMTLKDSSLNRLNSMKSESHQKGFLAVRKLLQHIGYNDFDLFYDESGKPNIKPQSSHTEHVEVSISHSHCFSAIVISDKNVGLDIEILKPKTLKIAPRFMDVSHLENLSESEKIKKATVIWGIKESIFKIKNEKGISFPEHIFEEEFNLEDKKARATLKFNNQKEKFEVAFDLFEEYIFVCAFKN